ncbi:DUF58 domain-containing protein [Microlunatus flavus]|uniref:DUF58 domain-containing protein n=1 Tax=Microlunatus flavus TaxID=1036181 RepID=A0A1H9M2B2_9ACTN|nr:DUF58 domain-containing protein [Microlunatus flavus]SER17679.1 Protein of unknown function DUF58 [Microlunatus flavus]
MTVTPETLGTAPARPTAPDALLHRLEWTVLRQLDGRLQGAYRSPRRGSGMDLAGLRAYAEGDDARHIDWNVTARLDEPQVREFSEDRELTAWLVLDRSASMGVGGARSGEGAARGKADVLTELALVLARLLGRSGNRVGAVLYGSGAPRVVPPGSGRNQALRIARELGRDDVSAAAPVPPPARGSRWRPRRSRARTPAAGSTTDLAAMLGTVAGLARRNLVVVVSDFIGTGDWQRPLVRLAHRNEVVALRVVDAADEALPDVGLVVVEDAETGEQLLLDSGDPWFRARFDDGVARRDDDLRTGMRQAGVPLHRVDTAADLVTTLVEVVGRTRQPVRGGAS